MVLKSTLTPANTKSPSLRATVPEAIVEFLGVKAGDELLWTMDDTAGRRFSVVKKA